MEPRTPNRLSSFRPDYAQAVWQYLETGGHDGALRPHQVEVLSDIATFLEGSEPRGYVESSTGTGKTVAFVKLCEALMQTKMPDGRSPRILVVTPKVDLVGQTIGRTGEKGFGRFAPNLVLGSFFSDSTQEERRNMQDADVVATTYDSFSIMSRRPEMIIKSPEEIEADALAEFRKLIKSRAPENVLAQGRRYTASLLELFREAEKVLHNTKQHSEPTGRMMLDAYDAYILDEAHHALGESVKKVLAQIDPAKPVIGFTATPDASERRQLSEVLPARIHQLNFSNAIGRGLLAPVVSLSLETNIPMRRTDIYDSHGDYIDAGMSHLALSEHRNEQVVKATEVFTGHGIGTLISCIAGDGAYHARHIAQLLREKGVAAEAVYGEISPAERRRMYKQFEEGELDALTYIEVLGEGYDSQRAKAVMNTRPTRSKIVAQQRAGRVARLGNVAFIFDFQDKYDALNPPIFAPDLLGGSAIERGTIYGKTTPEQQQHVQDVIAALGERVTLAVRTPADYSNIDEVRFSYSAIKNGRMLAQNTGSEYGLPAIISQNTKGLNDEIIQRLWSDSGQSLQAQEGLAGDSLLKTVYDVKETAALIEDMPISDIDKAIKDTDNQVWMSTVALSALFKKKYSHVTQKMMDELLDEIPGELDWRPVRCKIVGDSANLARYRAYKAYKIDKNAALILNDRVVDRLASLGLI